MGTFAGRTIVKYCLSFANQGEKTSVFHIHLQLTNEPFHFQCAGNKRKLSFSIHSLFRVCVCVHVGCHFKRKMEAQAISLISSSFAHCANGSLLFVLLLTRNKQTLSVCKWTKWTKQTWSSIFFKSVPGIKASTYIQEVITNWESPIL